jgi:hypothetical protein
MNWKTAKSDILIAEVSNMSNRNLDSGLNIKNRLYRRGANDVCLHGQISFLTEIVPKLLLQKE